VRWKRRRTLQPARPWCRRLPPRPRAGGAGAGRHAGPGAGWQPPRARPRPAPALQLRARGRSAPQQGDVAARCPRLFRPPQRSAVPAGGCWQAIAASPLAAVPPVPGRPSESRPGAPLRLRAPLERRWLAPLPRLCRQARPLAEDGQQWPLPAGS
jgi:hypothetical protein